VAEKVKQFKQVCTCENCGNEAEMVVTCSLEAVEEAELKASEPGQAPAKRVKGTGTCSECGGEADIWVDL
jgi:hypothetical protein